MNVLYRARRNPYRVFQFPENNPVWKEYLQNKLPLMIVFGDYFVYRDTTSYPGRILYIRDVEINSNTDLDLAIAQGILKRGNVQKTDHTFLGKCGL